MKKEDYFKLALERGWHQERAWIISVFAVSDAIQRIDGHRRIAGLIEFDLDGATHVIADQKEGEPLYLFSDPITVDGSWLPIIKDKVKTTYGQLLCNALMLYYPFGDRFEYINGAITPKMLSSVVVKALKADEIGHDEVIRYHEAISYVEGFTQLCVTSATPKTVTTDPAIAVRREQLLEEYKDRLHEPAIIAKIEKELVDMDKAFIKGDPAERFYKSNKSYGVVRKQAYLMHGGEASFHDENKLDLIPRSLQEGWDVNYMPQMINSSRDGSYSRGAETMLGGTAVKRISRVFQNTHITMDDCKDKLGTNFDITSLTYREFVGRYQLVNGELKELDEATLKGLVGKTVTLRSPMSCKAKYSDYCSICMGKEIADSPTALNMLAVNVGSAFMGISMQRVHGRVLETEEYRLADRIS